MTAERSIAYIGLAILFVNIFPFSDGFIILVNIISGIGLILIGSYMAWKRRIRNMSSSIHGHIAIPDFVDRIQYEELKSNTVPLVDNKTVEQLAPRITKRRIKTTTILESEKEQKNQAPDIPVDEVFSDTQPDLDNKQQKSVQIHREPAT